MFDANYPIHFVVGDSSDTYYAASGLQLNLNQNIALELGNEWENILFLKEDIHGEPCVYNRKEKYLEEYTKKTWGKSKAEVCRSKLFKALSESRQRSKTAVIADLSAFCNLMKDDDNCLQRMSSIMNNGKGLLILLIPQTVDPALPYLTDPDGLFLQGDASAVCPQIKYLNSVGAELFQGLRVCNQFKFMSELTPEICSNILVCALFEQQEAFFSSNEIANCAESLFGLCTNKGFRRYAKLMEGLSDAPKFSDVFTWLTQGKNLEKVFKLSQMIEDERNGRSITATVEALAGGPNKPQLIRRSDPLILDLCSIQYPTSWCESPDSELAEELERIQEKAFYPYAVRQNDSMTVWLQSLLKTYRDDALKLKDEQYLKDILHVICFAADKLYADNNDASRWLQSHREALETWITLSRKLVLDRKTLHDRELLLQASVSETLFYIHKEQKVTVESFQKLYDETTGFITPMLNNQEEITLSQVTEILENLKELSAKAEKERAEASEIRKHVSDSPKREITLPTPEPPPIPIPEPPPINSPDTILLTRDEPVQEVKTGWSDEETERRKREQRNRIRQERNHNNILGN